VRFGVKAACRSLVLAITLAIVTLLAGRHARASERQIPTDAARARTLRADADVASCVTVSQRTPDQIIVRASLYASDPPGITIVEGETLCLAAEVGSDERLRKMHLANVALGEPVLVRLQLDPPGASPRLHVEGASELAPFDFLFGTAVASSGAEQRPDGGSLAAQSEQGPRFVRVGPVFMGAWADVDVPGASVHEILITELASRKAAPPRAPVPRTLPPFPSRPFGARTSGGELSAFSGVMRFRHLAGVDDALLASGYGPFPAVVPSVGGVLGASVRRWQLRVVWDGTWMSASSRTSPATVQASLISVGLEAGYDFLRWRGLTGNALLGVSGSTFTMDARGPNWNYLGSGTATLGNPTTIQRDAGLFTVGAGFEQFIPTWGETMPLVVSVQGGYTQAFANSSWSSTENKNSVPDRSGLDASGSWVRVGLGMAFLDYW
jgi:hypothetical protein